MSTGSIIKKKMVIKSLKFSLLEIIMILAFISELSGEKFDPEDRLIDLKFFK